MEGTPDCLLTCARCAVTQSGLGAGRHPSTLIAGTGQQSTSFPLLLFHNATIPSHTRTPLSSPNCRGQASEKAGGRRATLPAELTLQSSRDTEGPRLRKRPSKLLAPYHQPRNSFSKRGVHTSHGDKREDVPQLTVETGSLPLSRRTQSLWSAVYGNQMQGGGSSLDFLPHVCRQLPHDLQFPPQSLSKRLVPFKTPSTYVISILMILSISPRNTVFQSVVLSFLKILCIYFTFP